MMQLHENTVNLSDDFQNHFGGDFRAVRQISFFRRRSAADILCAEAGFKLFHRFQMGFILRVGAGGHQDGSSLIASDFL